MFYKQRFAGIKISNFECFGVVAEGQKMFLVTYGFEHTYI